MSVGFSLYELKRQWQQLVFRHLGKNNLLSDLAQASGPLAICCAVLLLLCIIFTLRYRSRKGLLAALLSLVTGIGSGLLAWVWACHWFRYDGLEFVPVAVVLLVLLIMLIIFIRTSAARHAEKRKAHEARKAAMAAQLEAEREAWKAQHADQIEAVKAAADKLSNQAKEGISQLNAATRKILADGSQTVECTHTAEASAASLDLPNVYVPHQGHDPHAAQKLRGLHSLLQEGVITEEEYAAKAAQLLERL